VSRARQLGVPQSEVRIGAKQQSITNINSYLNVQNYRQSQGCCSRQVPLQPFPDRPSSRKESRPHWLWPYGYDRHQIVIIYIRIANSQTGMTWRANPPPAEQAYKAMKAALAAGANFWNGGENYGSPERNSLHLLNEYFTKYPKDAEHIVLSIKGGIIPGQMTPDGSEQGVKRSIDECLRVLDGKKFLDLFECARIDPNVPYETTIAAIDKYVEAGKIGEISLSEVGGY
jgi:Aldo/keto reductase family